MNFKKKEEGYVGWEEKEAEREKENQHGGR